MSSGQQYTTRHDYDKTRPSYDVEETGQQRYYFSNSNIRYDPEDKYARPTLNRERSSSNFRCRMANDGRSFVNAQPAHEDRQISRPMPTVSSAMPSWDSSHQPKIAASSRHHYEQPMTSQNRMMVVSTDNQCGLIILGNSGVGKSFLANILLGQEAFVHEISSSSVTHKTRYIEIEIGNCYFAVFDIPGLIEANQQRIELNKREIDQAFLRRLNSIIIYVFGQQNGRIRDEDIVAFKAINAAYSFQPEALVFIMNDLPTRRSPNYEGTTLILLQQLIPEFQLDERNVGFLDRIDPDDRSQRQFIKEQLYKILVNFTPMTHRKGQEIETLFDRLEAEKYKIRQQQAQFDAEKAKFEKKIAENQRRLDETIAQHRSEAESHRKALQCQAKEFEKQQQELEKERQKYSEAVQLLRKSVEQAKAEYEKLQNNSKAKDEEKMISYQAYKDLKDSLDQLMKQQQSTPPRKKGSSCVIF